MRLRKDMIAILANSSLGEAAEGGHWLCPACARLVYYDWLRDFHDRQLQQLTTWWRCRRCTSEFKTVEHFVDGQVVNVERICREDA